MKTKILFVRGLNREITFYIGENQNENFDVIDLDFTSLYPSIIKSLNLGIETLVGRVVNRDKFDNQWSLKELKAMDPNKTVTIEKVKKDLK